MKRTGLEKLAAKRLESGVDRRPAQANAPDGLDRRERRRRDQALGRVPFAVKIDSALAARLRERAAARDGDLDGLVGELLAKALDAS